MCWFYDRYRVLCYVEQPHDNNFNTNLSVLLYICFAFAMTISIDLNVITLQRVCSWKIWGRLRVATFGFQMDFIAKTYGVTKV